MSELSDYKIVLKFFSVVAPVESERSHPHSIEASVFQGCDLGRLGLGALYVDSLTAIVIMEYVLYGIVGMEAFEYMPSVYTRL